MGAVALANRRRLPCPGRHRTWPCSIDLPQWQPIRVVLRPDQGHRCGYTEYKTDRARWRNRVLGQEGQATISGLAIPPW